MTTPDHSEAGRGSEAPDREPAVDEDPWGVTDASVFAADDAEWSPAMPVEGGGRRAGTGAVPARIGSHGGVPAPPPPVLGADAESVLFDQDLEETPAGGSPPAPTGWRAPDAVAREPGAPEGDPAALLVDPGSAENLGRAAPVIEPPPPVPRRPVGSIPPARP